MVTENVRVSMEGALENFKFVYVSVHRLTDYSFGVLGHDKKCC